MRVKVLLSALTLFFVLSIAFIPSMILSTATRVEVTPVRKQNYQDTVYCNGEIIEKRVKEIYLDTPVIAEQISVEVGDRVWKGQRLASIDTKLTQTALANGVNATELDYPETAELPADVAALAAQVGLSGTDIQSALNQYQEATTAETQSSKSTFIPNEITAPMNGIVTAINLQTDVLTRTSKPVLVVSDDSAYAARVSVNEADVAKLRVGNTAVITGTGFGDHKYSAVVSKIYPTARKSISGTTQQVVVDVELQIQKADERIKPGFSAKAVIATEDAGERLTVPYTAVCQGNDNREYLYVFQNNHLQKRYIETGIELADSVEVVSGVKLGEAVVTNPGDIKDESRFAYTLTGKAGSV
ncbi:efflux RND transporter periplasmic adaptor subunit [Ligaoa zhengdingensis]|uniref:efflux RND transporter periplasmic adaptor subunit n=2 Tax=Ligaoa zhengdingensis TaxID=2763658 RepID=UPI0031BAE498